MGRRRPPAAAILALAAVALCAGPAAAQSVQVYRDGQGPMTPQLAPPGTEAQYYVNPPGGDEGQNQHFTAYYFKDVLDDLGIQATALDVVGGGQPYSYTLDSTAEIDGSANYKGVEPFLWLEDVAKSIRPMRDADDVNAGDITPGDPLYLFAHSNGSIPFTFSYSVHGTTVDFTPSRSDCSVRWFYGDPATSSDTAGTFTYPTTSQYVAIADAECGDGGGAAVKLVNVGAGAGPTPGPDPTATATATASPRPTRTPKPRATATATATATPHKSAGGSGSPAATATATATATAAPTATAQATATATATATPGSKTSKKTAPAPPHSDLPEVHGRLISAIVPVSPASLAPAAAPPATSAAGGGSPPGRFTLPFGLLALAALLLAGAWRERRGR